jgi:hypothetical protein
MNLIYKRRYGSGWIDILRLHGLETGLSRTVNRAAGLPRFYLVFGLEHGLSTSRFVP